MQTSCIAATTSRIACVGNSAAVAWALFDGTEQVFGNNVYHLTVSSAGIGLGVIWACVVALLGGLFPSIRAARRPVAEALRAI